MGKSYKAMTITNRLLNKFSRSGKPIRLEVIKTPHWVNKEHLTAEKYYSCDSPKVGDITWCFSKNLCEVSIVLEDNRFKMNFDPSCFRVLDKASEEEYPIY